MVMQTQPSAQGIASLYMGNPEALQQRVQKEQQAKPGLPPDLKKLMALDIVTNVEDANKRQQAMNALNSMAPAGQEPPTVAQSIQAQAKQAVQARMLQEQRKQQGLQALAERSPSVEVPEGVQFAQSQPQGIDELPVDMEFAGGGIVSFSDGKSVPRVSAPVGNPQEELINFLRTMGLTPEEFTQAAPKVQNEIRDMFRSSQEAAKVLNAPPAQTAAPAAQAAAPVAEAAETAAQKSSGIRSLLGKAAPLLGRVAGWAPTAMYSSELNANEDDQLKKKRIYGELYGVGDAPATIKALAQDPNISAKQFQERAAAWFAQNPDQMPAEGGGRAQASTPRKITEGTPTTQGPGDRVVPRYPTSDQKAAAEQRAPRPAPGPRPAPAVSDTYPDESMRGAAANPQNAPVGLDALREKFLRERMSMDPAARAEAARKRHEEAVGRLDTSQYDRLIAELEGRRKQFDAPKEGFDAFAEFMGQIAAQGPRRTWAESGARGVAAQKALDKERQAQQFELTRQMVDTAQKKLEAERGYKKELFTLTEKERDAVDKEVEEAVKLYDLSKRDADKYRRDLELEEIRRKNSLALEGVRARNQAANRTFNSIEERYRLLKTGDPVKDAALLEKLERDSNLAKKPGIDQTQIDNFTKANKESLTQLKRERMMARTNPEKYEAQYQATLTNLRRAAENRGLDPDSIPDLTTLGGSTTQSGNRTIDWNSIK